MKLILSICLLFFLCVMIKSMQLPDLNMIFFEKIISMLDHGSVNQATIIAMLKTNPGIASLQFDQDGDYLTLYDLACLHGLEEVKGYLIHRIFHKNESIIKRDKKRRKYSKKTMLEDLDAALEKSKLKRLAAKPSEFINPENLLLTNDIRNSNLRFVLSMVNVLDSKSLNILENETYYAPLHETINLWLLSHEKKNELYTIRGLIERLIFKGANPDLDGGKGSPREMVEGTGLELEFDKLILEVKLKEFWLLHRFGGGDGS